MTDLNGGAFFNAEFGIGHRGNTVPERSGVALSFCGRPGSCSSSRSFGFGFLQTPPRDDALAVSLAFGSAKTWLPDFHRHSYVPCPAHTFELSRAAKRRRLE